MQQAHMQHQSHPQRDVRARGHSAGGTTRIPTVILADDSILQRMMMRAVLEAEGFHVLEAGTGREVLELVHLAQPDLILMDVAMPSMDGITAARRLRSERDAAAEIPIVFLTALDESDDRDRALAAGGNGYLVKPIGDTELVRVVKEWTGPK
jgi:CheY-like chemotaxis protein